LQRIFPLLILVYVFQKRHLKILTGGRMNDYLVSPADDIADGVTATGQKKAVLGLVTRTELPAQLQTFFSRTARLII